MFEVESEPLSCFSGEMHRTNVQNTDGLHHGGKPVPGSSPVLPGLNAVFWEVISILTTEQIKTKLFKGNMHLKFMKVLEEKI